MTASSSPAPEPAAPAVRRVDPAFVAVLAACGLGLAIVFALYLR